MTQKEREERNKRDLERLVASKDELLDYFYSHTNKETMDCFGVSSNKVLAKALKMVGYDPSYKKGHSAMRGRKSSRSHESYVLGGKKSSITQKASWEAKSQDDKEAWSNLMKESHGEEFKKKISAINKNYLKGLSQEKKDELRMKRRESSKRWWNGLSDEDKHEIVQNNMRNGAGWNHAKIQETVKERYGVDNIAQLDSVKKKYVASMNKTCLEKYGVMWCCQLSQCNDAIGSKGEHTKPNEDFLHLLESIGIKDISREFVIPKTKYRYDFKIGNTLIEIDPCIWHNSTFNPKGEPKPMDYHYNKSKCAFENGYKCIHVFDWDDLGKIAELLKPRESVGARECKVKEVSKEDAMDFINKHHLQGYARDRIRLGLYHKGELVSIMTFHKPRYNKNYEYELIRYCSSMNVIGGAERLFKHFLKSHSPKSVITYCDKSKFTGGLYAKLGFSLLRRGKPSKHWYNIKTGEHYTDNLIRQQGFSRIVNHVDASQDNVNTNNNNELMIEHGFVEVYDCGQDTYCYVA